MKAKQERECFGDFADLLRRALGSRLREDAVTFLEMMAEDGVMEFPYAPPGFAERLQGRLAIAGHLETLAPLLAITRFSVPTVHHTTQDSVTILEFRCEGRGLRTGKPYNQRYISVVTIEAGRIIHFADYWNPLIAMEGLGLPESVENGGFDA